MISRIRLFAVNLILILPLLFASAAIVKAQPTDTTNKLFGACAQAPDSPACRGRTTTENPVVRVINITANLIAVITGVVAVIIIILGGLSYITAGGNAEQATNARRRIVYALVGVVIVALAWAITRFVTGRVIN